MGITIIVDSVSDIPKSLLEQYNIKMLPLTVHFGNEVYRDNVDITSEEFYQKLQSCEILPTTSQVTPVIFEEAFAKEVEKGNEIICFTLSSEGSGTYQSANIAAAEFEGKISIIDSLSFSMGEGILALEAAKLVGEGLLREEIVEAILELKKRNKVYFVVDDLKHLQRGGRISGAAAFIGGVLNLKPILTIENGLTKPIDKVRGKKKAHAKLVDLMKEDIDLSLNQMFIGHGAMLEAAQELKDQIQQEFPHLNIGIIEIGSVVGTNAGPGCLGIFYLTK